LSDACPCVLSMQYPPTCEGRRAALIRGTDQVCVAVEVRLGISYNILKYKKKWLPGLQRRHPHKYLSCQELHTKLRCGLPLRQPRETWAATISREIRCDRVLQLLNEHLAKNLRSAGGDRQKRSRRA